MPRPIPLPESVRSTRVVVVLCAGLLGGLVAAGSGCRGPKTAKDGDGDTNAVAAAVTYRPLDGSVGKVMQVNERLRFAVLDYTLNRMPPPGTVLQLYRSTNVVGSLKLSGWRSSLTAAADFVEGVPEVGDVARPR